MSRSLVTNVKHFIDEKGAIPESMPKPAKKLIENLGNIIVSVTTLPKTNVSCWNKINGKNCSGKIDADIDLENFDILWRCLKCKDNGLINNWEHTFWDNSNGKN
tara:strand:+ start:308 stop:619 length:312 start_codon:yes stop_codon:yes gene_type:complete